MTKKCVLEIRDEVNIKFHGLDPDTRRKMKEKVEYMLPYARHTPAFKLGRWSGKVSFCDIGGRSYFALLDRLLPIILQAGYELDLDDKRLPYDISFDEIKEDSYSHVNWPADHRFAGEPIMFRDYQVEVINEYLRNLQSLQEVSTGAGKTVITAVLADQASKYGRTITIVPSKDLVMQTEEDFINMGLDVGVYFGDRKDYNKTHTICTWQGLDALDRKHKKYDDSFSVEEFLEGVVCVIVDECFAPGTKILTTNGYINIENIKIGDKVINYSESSGEFKEDNVLKIHTNLLNSKSEKMYLMEFDNGSKLKVTGNHKFLTTRGWVRADELLYSDIIMSYNDK